jgi:triacylglycerol lipase
VEKHGIYRQSVGSIMGSAKSAGFPLNYFYLIVKDFDGANDGLVSDKSFEFGEKFTLLTPKTRRGISHMDVIDMVKMDVPDFDVREFYVDLVRDLRERGL